MIFGDFQFKIKTISQKSLNRILEISWSEIERIGDLPFLQYLGRQKETIEITGTFYPKFSENYKCIDNIRESKLCKTANNLISDTGEILGKFVITSIEETQEYFDATGIAKKIEFSIKLKRAADDQNSYIENSSTLFQITSNITGGYLKW